MNNALFLLSSVLPFWTKSNPEWYLCTDFIFDLKINVITVDNIVSFHDKKEGLWVFW